MVSESVKEKLLKVAGTSSTTTEDNHSHNGGGSSSSIPSHGGRKRGHKKALTESDIIEKFKGKARKNNNPKLRRRFLIRLAIALHSYGSSASRTEYLLDKAADRLDVDLSISVFPSLILMSFPGTTCLSLTPVSTAVFQAVVGCTNMYLLLPTSVYFVTVGLRASVGSIAN